MGLTYLKSGYLDQYLRRKPTSLGGIQTLNWHLGTASGTQKEVRFGLSSCALKFRSQNESRKMCREKIQNVVCVIEKTETHARKKNILFIKFIRVEKNFTLVRQASVLCSHVTEKNTCVP